MRKHEKVFNRHNFEQLVHGDWVSEKDDRIRRNGAFSTYVRKPWKFVSDGQVALRAKTWKELAIALKLVKGKGKADDNDVSNDEEE